MPTGREMFSAIFVMKILSLVLTKSLGNYKTSYLKSMDNEGRSFVRKFVTFFLNKYWEYWKRTLEISVHVINYCIVFCIIYRRCLCSFQENLAVIQEEINQRNAAIIASNDANDVQEYPYEWLLPEKVLNSISI